MPLAECTRAVPIEAHHLGHRRNAIRNLSGVARKSGRRLHNGAGIGLMMVSTGLQRVPRWRAECRRVEVVIAQAAGGQAVHRRRINGPAKRCGRSKADIINQHNNDIRCALWRLNRKQRGCLDITNVELLKLGRIRLRNGEMRAIHLEGLRTDPRSQHRDRQTNPQGGFQINISLHTQGP